MLNFDAIVMDLDDTLLNSEKGIGAEMLFVLGKLVADKEVIFATARPPRFFKQSILSQFMNKAHFVSYNGALTFSNKLNYFDHVPIEKEISSRIIEDVFGKDPGASCSMEVNDCWMAVHTIDLSDLGVINDAPKIVSIKEFVDTAPTKILVCKSQLNSYLARQYAGQVSIVETDSCQVVHIMNSKTSKNIAVANLLSKLTIKPSETIVFGNDHNDESMFRSEMFSVAMGNSAPKLLELANYVTDTNDNDGVLKALRYLSIV